MCPDRPSSPSTLMRPRIKPVIIQSEVRPETIELIIPRWRINIAAIIVQNLTWIDFLAVSPWHQRKVRPWMINKRSTWSPIKIGKTGPPSCDFKVGSSSSSILSFCRYIVSEALFVCQATNSGVEFSSVLNCFQRVHGKPLSIGSDRGTQVSPQGASINGTSFE